MDLQPFAQKYVEFARELKEELNELDAAQGDGDLGNTIVKGAEALHEKASDVDSIPDWLIEGGKAFRKAAPSTMGILLASALIKAGKELRNEENINEQSMEDWKKAQSILINDIQKRGEAKQGDKTILDALIPAVEAFHQQENQVSLALEAAALKAKEGAEETKEMQAKIGRSSWMGERAKGHMDGGAWFCYKTYQFLFDWVNEKEKLKGAEK